MEKGRVKVLELGGIMKEYDVIIIGAGIIGSLTARELSRYDLRILWIEKNPDIGMGSSSANSAIIHSGHDPKPGTLKAEMNVRGNKLWKSVAPELDIAHKECGSYIVAIGVEEFELLSPLYENGVQNGVPGLEIISRTEMLNREPLLNPRVSGALYTPTAGVIDPFGAVVAAGENAVTNGVELLLNCEFLDFIIEDKKIVGVKTSQGNFACRFAVNAGGLFSDEILHRASSRPEFKITPRRGEYLVFDSSALKLNNVLFPMPSQKGKGCLVTTTTHGNVMIGPNANEVDSKENTETAVEGLFEILEKSKKLVPSINARHVIAQFAGIRATGNANKDFVIEASNEVFGLVSLAGIESPGFASAPAIAERAVEILKEIGLPLKKNPKFNPVRSAPPVFHRLSHVERGELVKQNPAYGRIVCRCEEVTEGEIRAAIHSPIPATTYDAIKRRTWLGTGRCQGGFDYPRVMEILSEELGIPMTAVTKEGAGSEIVYRRTKEPGQ